MQGVLTEQLEVSKRRWHGWLVVLLLAAETTAAAQIPHPWFSIYLFRGVPVFFALTLLFFGRQELRALGQPALQTRWAVLHAALLAGVIAAEAYLLAFAQRISPGVYNRVGDVWAALLSCLVPSALLTFYKPQTLVRVGRRLGGAWVLAAVSSIALVVLMEWLHRSWDANGTTGGVGTISGLGAAFQSTAFAGTRYLLLRFYPIVIADPRSYLLGTDRFQIIVGSTCSGVQGLALLSVLLVSWMLWNRQYLRTGRVLLLGCAALAAMWGLNLVRLAALIAIGSAGYPQIALNGFHSEAGWISLNALALCLLLVLERMSWFQRTPVLAGAGPALQGAAQNRARRNVPAIYLLPFLAITAASILSHAVSSGFEWLYPLRFFVAGAALYFFRREYKEMDLRFGVVGVLAGLATALLWIGAYRWQTAHEASQGTALTLAQALAALPGWDRVTWIIFRVLAAITTVPLAEELAFRGYLARRVMGEDVEAIPYARLSVAAVVVSGICFGLLHGSLWGVGIVAGFVFGWVARRTNRLGDAVAAHAIANLCLAGWVLLRGDFGLW